MSLSTGVTGKLPWTAALGGVLAVSAWAAGQQARVYYDTVEDGRLTGGEIVVDLSDPVQRAQYGELPQGYRLLPWPVTTVRNNGPSDNRIDLVIVGDGYTATEMTKYSLHVDTLLASFFVQEPLAAYASYFNVHRVDVVSAESGVDEIDHGIFKDTALDMAYGCFGATQGLCINASKAIAAAGSAPQVDQILALANSTRYGGAGYASSNLGTVAGNNSSAVEIALHEFGHAFANLADEYGYGANGPYTGDEFSRENVTIYPAAILTNSNWKWYRWLDLPNVDTFVGGATYATGVYRPTMDSKMRTLGRPFEEVNVEQFVKTIYGVVSPVDDATPTSAQPLSPCDARFFVAPLQPADHSLAIQWKVNGAALAGQTSPTFQLSWTLLRPGQNTVSVSVTDTTTRVRDQSFRITDMTFSRQWTVEPTGLADSCDCGACGDVDADGAVGLRDAAAFSLCFGKLVAPGSSCLCADLSGDQKVNLTDLRGLVMRLGAPPSLARPCMSP